MRLWNIFFLVLVAALLTAGCSVNPATGKRQLNMVGEQQEIAMGQQNHPQIVAQFGLHPDEELQRYVQDLGAQLAAKAERPDLPWTFTLLDDPLVNAFAVPGGFIYVTRGILAHLNSEAELVGVLGHEIGHVTARHSVNQMSKQMLGQLALGVGMMASPDNARAINDLGGTGLGLLFLKYGRDDELQADSLGLRYAVAEGFDPHPIPEVFKILGRVSQQAGVSPTPNWMATHPSPVDRNQRLAAAISPMEPISGTVNRNEYLAKLEGVTFGSDPRQGYFKDGTFYHPEMAFQLTFPEGWATQNTRQAVVGVNEKRNAMMVLRLAEGSTAQEASVKFFTQEGVRQGRSWRDDINGLQAISRSFEVSREQAGDIQGVVAFVEHRQQVFQLLSYTGENQFRQLTPVLLEAMGSFAKVTDRRILSVQPRTLKVLRLNRSGPLAENPQLRGQDIAELELLNNLDPGQSVELGTFIKTVEGDLP